MDILIIACSWLIHPPWFAWLKKTFIAWKLPEKKEEGEGEGDMSLPFLLLLSFRMNFAMLYTRA